MSRVPFGYRLLSTAALLLASTVPSLGQQPYKVIGHWTIGGSGGWDYMKADPAAHLLYLAHGPRVEVIDMNSGKPVGAITGMKGTHGIALGPEGRFGYISDGRSNDVVVFDRKTFATMATIPAGTNPDGITYEPVTKTVWAFNGRSNSATVIDTVTRKVVATIALPGKPEFPQADGKGNVFDNIESKNSIVKLDAIHRSLAATWTLNNCESPSGLAYDKTHHRLFAVCDGKEMAVVDAETGKQLASATIGDGPDAARYSARHQLAFSSNGEGTLSVIDAAHGYRNIENLTTEKGARTMAYDNLTDRIYLVTAKFGGRPAATPENPRPRPAIIPGSFTVLVVARK